MLDNKVVLLYSGGVDSTILLYWLLNMKYEVFPLHVNYGQFTVKGELQAICNILNNNLKKRFLSLDVSNVGKIGMGSLVGQYPDNLISRDEWVQREFFPNRNMILLSLAATYGFKIGCKLISIGVAGENSYKDTTIEFIEQAEKLLGVALGDVKILAPYADVSRIKVLNDTINLEVPLEKTFSCNSLGERHCRLCTSCIEREQAINLQRELQKGRVNLL